MTDCSKTEMRGRQSFMNQKPRREFLKKAALALPIVAAADSAEVNAAEGKVEGAFDEETGLTKWSQKDDYQKKLEQVREAILSTKIVKGPWEKDIDKDLN